MNFETLFSTTVIKNIKSNGGEVYAVGGCVRDFYLNRKSKDIDVIVRLLPFDKLNPILLKTGKCDLVGQSFGVIKYIDNSGFELDIALPRTDKKGEGDKHQDIEAQSDPFMLLEEDLKRRDFTFNAMAIDMNLNLIDPFEGLKDLKNGVVKCVDDKAFVDDPLRIMRGLGFAAQLGFRIEKKTHGLIKIHKSKLNNISPERKHDELVKIACEWLFKKKHLQIVLGDFRTVNVNEHPDAIVWKSSGWSILIEVKTSRADFLRDAKKF